MDNNFFVNSNSLSSGAMRGFLNRSRFKDIFDNVVEKLENAGDQVSKKLEDFSDGADEVLENVSDKVSEKVEHAGDILESVLHRGRDWLNDTIDGVDEGVIPLHSGRPQESVHNASPELEQPNPQSDIVNSEGEPYQQPWHPSCAAAAGVLFIAEAMAGFGEFVVGSLLELHPLLLQHGSTAEQSYLLVMPIPA